MEVNEDQGCENIKKKKKVERKAPIRVIGDSMIRIMPEYVKRDMEGSAHTSLGGARTQEIGRKVKEETKDMKDGIVIIQGGGNNLEEIGSEATVKEVIEAIEAVEGKDTDVGILKRP